MAATDGSGRPRLTGPCREAAPFRPERESANNGAGVPILTESNRFRCLAMPGLPIPLTGCGGNDGVNDVLR